MDFAFLNSELRDVCEDRNVAIEKLGHYAAVELGTRLADMEAHATVAEYAALFDDVTIRSPTELELKLTTGQLLVFCAGHVKVPALPSGETDWSKVTKIRIVSLEVIDG